MKFYSLSGSLAAAAFLISTEGVKSQPVPFENGEINQVSTYSLYLKPGQPPASGYFPMGLVHGGRSPQAVALGFNLGDNISRTDAIFKGLPFPSPGEADPYGNQWYLMAWPRDLLAGSWNPSKGQDTLQTKIYGALKASPNLEGHPTKTPDIFDPDTSRYFVDYGAEMVKAYSADEPGRLSGNAIFRWGFDNEWEGTLIYSPAAIQAYATWLEKAYGGQIDRLNMAWQTTYPSFALAAEDSLPRREDYRKNPAAFLDFYSFESEGFADLLTQMAKVMFSADPLKRGAMLKSTQQTIEMPDANRRATLDQALFADSIRPYSGGLYGIDIYGAGDREAYEANYIYNCFRPLDRKPGYGVAITEANNHGGPGPEFASTFWRLLGNGVKAIDYFTLGWLGAREDWDKFGFIDAETGQPKEKLFYAARWAHTVHRSEKFWEESVPAEVPRLAVLLPRRDVLLSEPSNRDPNVTIWSYPRDHRWLIFRWLREQGYWVDILPYTKLNADYLRSYGALLLIGADHLTKDEQKVITDYVSNGGVVVADARAGYFDEHHLVLNQMEPILGLKLPSPTEQPGTDIHFVANGASYSAMQGISVEKTSATALMDDGQQTPLAFLNNFGKGRVLYFPFELGTLVNGATMAQGGGFVVTDGPTAEGEEYLKHAGEYDIGGWLGGLLSKAGLSPAYSLVPTNQGAQGNLRVEQPYLDNEGNCAVVIGNRAMGEPLPAETLQLRLPAGAWKTAYWAPAENDGLARLSLEQKGDFWQVQLPGIPTVGILYLFTNHHPLLGIANISGTSRSIDGFGARVKPGMPFSATLQIANTSGNPLEPGQLRITLPPGWTSDRTTVQTEGIPPGDIREYPIQITPDHEEANLRPAWLYPIVAHWSRQGVDDAVISANVEMEMERPVLLLSDNGTFPKTFPLLKTTGITYSYEGTDTAKVADPAAAGANHAGRALLSGYDHMEQRSSGINATRNYARYETPHIEALFDLKSAHQIDYVQVAPGPGPVLPSHLKLLGSTDGQSYTVLFDKNGLHQKEAIVSPLLKSDLRYVRVQVDWPSAGGTLDQVEIWGR